MAAVLKPTRGCRADGCAPLAWRCSALLRTPRAAVLPRRPRRELAHAARSVTSTSVEAHTYEGVWGQFAAKAPGEWEGITATFNAEGVSQPLPERFVPRAFREWGVELFDWQSQTSGRFEDAGSRRLRNLHKRLLPTVGCEAEAIAYTEEAADVWHADGGSAVKPVTPCGSYVAAPAHLPAAGGHAKVEAVLAAPDGQARVRAVVTLTRPSNSEQWRVLAVDVTRETYDGPYNGGIELCGCAPGGKAFAKEPAPSPQQLGGQWRPTTVLAYARAEAGLVLQPGATPDSRLSGLAAAGALALPPGVWVGCSAAGADVVVEVGALRGDAERDVAVVGYVDGRLERVLLGSEARAA